MGEGSIHSSTSTGSVSTSNPYAVLEGMYALHDELGSGGFGKVRLATHLLTGQKVAIKIIDKKAIGPDLPRVETEINALRCLQHQNICRLYHQIETDEKYFLYCTGGEMFDYIVRKERLEESEARHFFRQLVQAIAYIHHKGYAHRDLKPENLLLTEDLHLKVIDFGLCARPDVELSSARPQQVLLETCCGSPAYAAPELIEGKRYLGNAADIWSMGILLYALLCGALPFEDDNIQGLYRKIQRGVYPVPTFLSPCSKSLLAAMLKVDPRTRITIEQLLEHPWMNKTYNMTAKWKSIYDKQFVDADVAAEMAFHHSITAVAMVDMIKEWAFDYLTATYFILLNLKMKKSPYVLPMPRASARDLCNVVNSPTIHASLDNDLDRSGIEDDDLELQRLSLEDDDDRDPRFVHPGQNRSYGCAMQSAMMQQSVMTGRSPQQRAASGMGERRREEGSHNAPSMGTPAALSRRETRKDPKADIDGTNKENISNRGTYRIKGPLKVVPDDDRPRSVYSTPQRRPIGNLFSPSSARSARARSSERSNGASSTSSPSSGNWDSEAGNFVDRTPRSATKNHKGAARRVFSSLERKKEKIISMMTPRKLRAQKNDEPEIIKDIKGMVNLSITSSSDPRAILDVLVRVFETEQIKYEVNGWKICGKKKLNLGAQMVVELEVVFVESMGKVGVKRRRLNGDGFMYKKVCESILQMANIGA